MIQLRRHDNNTTIKFRKCNIVTLFAKYVFEQQKIILVNVQVDPKLIKKVFKVEMCLVC